MENRSSPHLKTAQNYWAKHLNENDLAIDATCGNGHDTKFLSEICHVVGLDIQKTALENTQKLLGAKKIDLHLLSHEFIDSLQLKPNLIVYNLGYLPSGDKSITTKVQSTLTSVKKGLEILQVGGALSITCYPGHDEGLLEEEALTQWAASLCYKKWRVCHHKWINRSRAPSLIWIKDQRSLD